MQESDSSSQYSVPVQKAPSSGHSTGVPGWQPARGSHTSMPVQYSPSEQYSLSGVCTQVSAVSSHASIVQATPSLQSTGAVSRQTPAPSQASMPSQYSMSGHGDPAGSKVQVALQQSPPSVLPSSHSSPGSTTPLPQTTSASQVSDTSLHT